MRRQPTAGRKPSRRNVSVEIFEKDSSAWEAGLTRWLKSLRRELVKPRADDAAFERLWRENRENRFESLPEHQQATDAKLDMTALRSSLTALFERTGDNRFQEALEAAAEYDDGIIETHRLRRERHMRESDRRSSASIQDARPGVEPTMDSRAKFVAAYFGVLGPVGQDWASAWKYVRKVLTTQDEVYEHLQKLKLGLHKN